MLLLAAGRSRNVANSHLAVVVSTTRPALGRVTVQPSAAVVNWPSSACRRGYRGLRSSFMYSLVGLRALHVDSVLQGACARSGRLYW